ncbi:MAG: type VII toxin-antitoxin system MntA family adenylyltransferase antitoxin, partial [Microgenomates group bacterium]
VVYGSKAKGYTHKESDLDIAVLTEKKPSYHLFKKLFSALSGIFKKENVDVRFLNEADPFFRFQVVKEGKLLYGNKSFYNNFKVQAIKVYIDDGRKYFPYLEKLLEKNQAILEKTAYA